MKSTRGPVALAVVGAALALASGVTAISASLGAASGASRFPVAVHEGMAPGAVPALVCLVGLVLVGVGAAVHDGRALRAPAPRGSTSPAATSRSATSTPAVDHARRSATVPPTRQVPPPRQVPPTRQVPPPGPVHVITTLPPRVAPPQQARPPRPARGRRTSAGTRLELVGATRRR